MLSEFLTEPVFTKGLSVSSNSAIKPHFFFHPFTLCVCMRVRIIMLYIIVSLWLVCVRIFCIKLMSHYFLMCVHILFCVVDILITANATCWHILMLYLLFITDFSLQSYLNTFAFKNTVYTDLWDHLQRVKFKKWTQHCHKFAWFQWAMWCACISFNVTLCSFSGSWKHAGFKYSSQCPGHYESLDSSNGLPSGHNWYADRKDHPETLPVGSRVCSREALSVWVGTSFTSSCRLNIYDKWKNRFLNRISVI